MFQMNCTSVFSFLPHKPSIPVSMPLYLSRDDFRCRRSSRLVKPLRPCLQHCSGLRVAPRSCAGDSEEHGKAKKQVSFADHKGQALTMVKVFSEFDDPIDIPLNIQELFGPVAGPPASEAPLVLDFAQPSSDYVQFRRRLDGQRVCLEHCVVKERSVAGTVKVRNLSFEKAVKIRVTFDTWKTFEDVECQYVRDTYGGSDYDTFSFEVDLPERPQLCTCVEFAVSYEVGGHTYWDSNQGQNYRVVQSVLKNGIPAGTGRHGVDHLDVRFDPYGSPRCSHGLFPEWPSYAGYEEIGPYY